MDTRLAALALLLCTSVSARAGECENNVSATGDPRNGQIFATSINIRGLTARSALGQIQQNAKDQGYKVGLPVLDSPISNMAFMQDSNQPPLMLAALFDGRTGLTGVSVQLNPGQAGTRDGVGAGLCKLLAGLKPGSEGEKIANASLAASGFDTVYKTTADALSASLFKEMEPARPNERLRISFAKSRGEDQRNLNDQVAVFMVPKLQQYLGRKYEVDGQVGILDQDLNMGYVDSKRFSFEFMVTEHRGLARVADELPANRFQVVCRLPPTARDAYASLKVRDWVRMTGVVTSIAPSRIELSNCQQAK